MGSDHLTLVNYYDRLFDQALTSQYNLSIRIDPDGLSFSVYSHLVSRYIVLESVILQKTSGSSSGEPVHHDPADRLNGFLIKHPWLLQQFRHTVIIRNSLIYTLVPHALYETAKKAAYLEFVYKTRKSTVIHEQFLNAADAWVVYSLGRDISDLLDHHFKGARFMHHAGAMIETILPRYRHKELRNPVFVNIRAGSFDMIVLKEGTLRYCNSFLWKTNEDLVYYLIFVLDQLALNPENITLMLLGLIEETSSLHELLRRYVRNIDFISNAEVPKSGISLSVANEYKFYDLLNPGLCG
ncbi:MAG: DUF3822 family protein [Bacteroidota bacterium]